MSSVCTKAFPARDYDLGLTFTSGQAFRWKQGQGGWTSVIGSRWIRLRAAGSVLIAETAGSAGDWNWLIDYLQLETDLGKVLESFPDDGPMRSAVSACRGLRLLRQDPWECLASFILSSTKQIVQIRQIISSMCASFGEQVRVPSGEGFEHAFPTAESLAVAGETELRACKMGFRAPYLLKTAQAVASGKVDLPRLRNVSLGEARLTLMSLPGVGRKVADCVLLFAYGFEKAFPVDVWIMRTLRRLYFPQGKVSLRRLQGFAETHFGPYAGYAQQYLFHYARTREIDAVALGQNSETNHDNKPGSPFCPR